MQKPPVHHLAFASHKMLRDIVRQYGPVTKPYRWLYRKTLLANLALSPLRQTENLICKYKLKGIQLPKSPIYILGYYRSGTTLLHNLFACDERFAYPTSLDMVAPTLCVSFRNFIRHTFGHLVPKKRPMDNMPLGLDTPGEEEIMMTCQFFPNTQLGFWFPQTCMQSLNQQQLLETMFALDHLNKTDLQQWYQGYTNIIKKCLYIYQKDNFVFKSPANTARIPHILTLFPNAKFITIHRNPYQVYQSCMNFYQKLVDMLAMQDISRDTLENFLLNSYRTVMKYYYEHKALIPKQNLVEIQYEELEKDPVNTVNFIYQQLSLNNFEIVKPKINQYLKTVENYQKNKFDKLDHQTIQKIKKNWLFAFEHNHYYKNQPA